MTTGMRFAYNWMAAWLAMPLVIGLIIVGVAENKSHVAQPAQPVAAVRAIAPQPKTSKGAVTPTIAQNLYNPLLAHRAEQIISSFENSSLVIEYDVAENIDDGRGITAGRAGFTSGTGDLLEVVQKYTSSKPANPLVKYLPALQKDNGSGSTAGLSNFPADWKKTVDTDPALIKAQDDVYDELYFDPALTHDKQLGITTSIGQLIILDTIVQHGDGSDPDGLAAIIKTTTSQIGQIGKDNNNEQAWLNQFLENRRKDLLNPYDKSSAAAWRESVSRVDALKSILNSGNPTLQNAISWKVYGDSYNLSKINL